MADGDDGDAGDSPDRSDGDARDPPTADESPADTGDESTETDDEPTGADDSPTNTDDTADDADDSPTNTDDAADGDDDAAADADDSPTNTDDALDDADGGAEAQADDAPDEAPPEVPYSRAGEDGEDDTDADDATADADGDEGDDEASDADDESVGGVGGRMGGAQSVNPLNDRERTGPSSDEELPVTAHIEEMLKRLLIVAVVVVVVAVGVFPLGEEIINFLWENALPDTETRPHLYSPLELVLTQIKVASLAGVVLALPVLVYQSYRFMRPGLYPHERRYYLAAVPTSLVLAFVGLVFGYFVMLPAIFTYFHSYSKEVTDIAFALGRTFDLILVLLGYLAVVFQIPLFIMLAMMMGVVTRSWLADRRLLFWGGFLGVSFLFSPDPTGMAPLILTLTMIVLFEGTLLLTKWTRRGRERMAA